MSDEAELYTVLEVENVRPAVYDFNYKGELVELGPGWSYYHAIYRNYTRITRISVAAKDELEAFVLAQAHIDKTKRAHDRRKQREGAK